MPDRVTSSANTPHHDSSACTMQYIHAWIVILTASADPKNAMNAGLQIPHKSGNREVFVQVARGRNPVFTVASSYDPHSPKFLARLICLVIRSEAHHVLQQASPYCLGGCYTGVCRGGHGYMQSVIAQHDELQLRQRRCKPNRPSDRQEV